jgi:hypothetical protein
VQTFKNVSPYGDLDVPLLGRVVKAGEVFEVTPDQARGIAGQDENFQKIVRKKAPAGKAAKKPPPEPELSASEPQGENQ